ncbi:hypothetical protein [Mesorhizobium sp. NBSH29]|uniref:hypothetical protein n=1 Tax=Mesorhizobium sp. NBSH29 TaxID=2654249 RepID=UPI00189652DB|nr:hypothetical protein [Mesorhizobium sp. NBSH29]
MSNKLMQIAISDHFVSTFYLCLLGNHKPARLSQRSQVHFGVKHEGSRTPTAATVSKQLETRRIAGLFGGEVLQLFDGRAFGTLLAFLMAGGWHMLRVHPANHELKSSLRGRHDKIQARIYLARWLHAGAQSAWQNAD